MNAICPNELLRGLFEQVRTARKTGSRVVTILTRPMWELLCEAAGAPECDCDCELFGSPVVVVESRHFASMSFAVKRKKKGPHAFEAGSEMPLFKNESK